MDVSFATEPGSPTVHNEDCVAATDSAVVVLDGLTAPVGLSTGCMHGTPWYVRVLAGQLCARLSVGQDALPSVLRGAIADVAALHAHTCDLSDPGTPSATVAIVRGGEHQVDYLVLADVTILLDGPAGLKVVTDDRVEAVSQDEVRATRALPVGSQEHQASLAALVTAQRRHRNQPGGYWIAAAAPEAADHAITGSLPRSEIARAALMTDGAARLVDVFHLSDWQGALDLLESDGPRELIGRVRQAESSDGDGAQWPRYKRSDDATVAIVHF